MKLKHLFGTVFGVAAMLTTALVPVMAQEEDPWSAYIYSSHLKQLVRVYLDGTSETYDLGLPQDSYIGSRHMAFSADGDTVAFCQPVNTTNGTEHTLIVRDLEAAQNTLETTLGVNWDCHVDQHSLSDDGSKLAVSTMNNQIWKVMVFDLTNGGLIAELTSSDENAPAKDDAFGDMFVTVNFNRFRGQEVTFTQIPFGTEGPERAPSHTWNYETGDITESPSWGTMIRAYLPETGELVSLSANPDREAGNPGGPMPSYNEVRVINVDSDHAEPQLILYSSAEVPFGLSFIENGERLAINLLQSFDFNTPDERQETRWIALDRDGNIEELAKPESFSQIGNAPQGLVLLEGMMQNETSPVFDMRLSYTSAGQTTTLWTLEGDPSAGGVLWELAWTAPMETTADLQPFAVVTE